MPTTLSDAPLAAFVAAWIAEARGESEDGAASTVHYVDAFAGTEWSAGAALGAESCAAGAAASAAEAGAAVVLVEEDPVLVVRLQDDLVRRGCGDRLCSGRDPAPGEIALIEADFRDAVDAVMAVPEGGRVRLRAAPPSARRLEWRLLAALLEDPSLELLLRFPSGDFAKQSHLTGPLADLPPFARRLVEGCSSLLGDPRHAWLAAWRATQRVRGPEASLEEVVTRFARRLADHAGGRLVKSAGQGCAELDFLVTASPIAAIALNDAVGPEPVPQPASAAGPVDLFGAPLVEPVADPIPALAERIVGGHRGRVVTLSEIIGSLALTSARMDQVRRALALLRRSGRAEYGSLRTFEAPIHFPRRPVPPSRPPRARTALAAGDLFSPP